MKAGTKRTPYKSKSEHKEITPIIPKEVSKIKKLLTVPSLIANFLMGVIINFNKDEEKVYGKKII